MPWLREDEGVVRALVDGAQGEREVAVGTLDPAGRFWDVRTDARPADDDTRAAALGLVVSALADRVGGHGTLRWWVTAPDPVTDALANDLGLPRRRDLLQLRRPLPLDHADRGERPPLATRPIRLVPGEEDAVVAVNNRAFAWHPDQADRTRAWIDGRVSEPWFEQAGFLVHEGDRGGIDGFCWTKVHADHDPPLGEIFVIGIDPGAQGRGLGRGLTIAGLDHLADRGLTVGMLYVEGANAGARAMYERLGFTLHHIERAYQPEG